MLIIMMLHLQKLDINQSKYVSKRILAWWLPFMVATIITRLKKIKVIYKNRYRCILITGF